MIPYTWRSQKTMGNVQLIYWRKIIYIYIIIVRTLLPIVMEVKNASNAQEKTHLGFSTRGPWLREEKYRVNKNKLKPPSRSAQPPPSCSFACHLLRKWPLFWLICSSRFAPDRISFESGFQRLYDTYRFVLGTFKKMDVTNQKRLNPPSNKAAAW